MGGCCLVCNYPTGLPTTADAELQTSEIPTLCPELAAGLVDWLASLCLAVCPLAETNPVEQNHRCRRGSGRDWCGR